MTQTPVSSNNPLTGSVLLERYKHFEKQGLSHADIAVECGYYSEVEKGENQGMVRANTASFNRALLNAQGFHVPDKRQLQQRSSKNRVVVGKAGRATLAQGLLASIGAYPGAKLEFRPTDEGLLLVIIEAGTPAQDTSTADTDALDAAPASLEPPTLPVQQGEPALVAA